MAGNERIGQLRHSIATLCEADKTEFSRVILRDLNSLSDNREVTVKRVVDDAASCLRFIYIHSLA